MDSLTAQQSFFQHIKSILPNHLSLIDEIADVLSISNDSVYRRVRGEKPITLDEAAKLAAHYKISLDQFLHLQSDSFICEKERTKFFNRIRDKIKQAAR